MSMHEFSIALNIIEIAEEECLKSRASSIREINLKIGTLSGVVPDALEFALTEAVKGSLLQDANIHFKLVPGKAQCNNCKSIFPINQFYDLCPNCQNYKTTLLEGKELQIISIVVND